MQPRKSLVKRKLDVQGSEEAAAHFDDAISLAASRVTEMAPLQGLLPHGGDDNFISFGRASSSSSSSSSQFSGYSQGEGSTPGGYESDRSEVPEKSEPSPVTSPTTRESFSGTTFEQRVAIDVREAHLTLITLPSPITIQGPCGVYGLGGETSINGYLIGQKRMLLASRNDRATAAPVKRLGTKTSEATRPTHEDVDPESIFGVVNWGWVRERLESWSRRNPVQMSMLLVIQHRDTCKKQWFEKSAVDPREVPSFIANYRYLATPPPVLEVVSTIAKQRQAIVAVVGERDVGKSTTCRLVANALLSQHGKCYWIDLDLGQPEFTVPGCLSVVHIKRPLTTDVIPTSSWELSKCLYLGTTSIACPISYAVGLKTLTDFVRDNSCYPCVINTHGWVQSSGRRGSIECIRRLRATHIFHLGKSNGADMEWTTGKIVGDPTNGINSSISAGRFWHGTDVGGSLPTMEEQAAPYHCRIHHVEVQKGAQAVRAGKRDRDEAQSGGDADAQVYRVIADYVTRPKGDNVKRRRAKWFNYFTNLWSGGEGLTTEVSLELAKLAFIGIGGADATSGVHSDNVAAMFVDSVVAVCINTCSQALVGGTPGSARLLSTFKATPSALCFGVVIKQESGKVVLAIPQPSSFVVSTLGAHKGSLGIVISTDRVDYSGVIQKTAAANR